MWQRFTERARKVVFHAQEEAQNFGEGYVSTEHLLLGLVREPDSLGSRVLEMMGAPLARVRADVEKQLPRGDARPSQDMTLTPRAKRVIDLAYDEARNLNNNYIGTEHLLLGLIREGDGLAGRVLAKVGAELEKARRLIMDLQDSEAGKDPGPVVPPPERTPQLRTPLAPALLPIRQELAVPEFLFLICVADETGTAAKALRACGAIVGQLQTNIEVSIYSKRERTCPFSLDDILLKASELAKEDEKPLSSGYLVLALLVLEAPPVTEIVLNANVTVDEYREHLKELE